MNNTYNKLFQSYYDKDLHVTPLNGKAPFLKNWVLIEAEYPYSKGDNIGLILGKRSGVIALDIDTEDNALKDKIRAILPPIMCGKTGNKDRLPTIFFQYNGERSQKMKGIVEILSDGNQTVLPPSMHPDKGYEYEWVGQPLLDIDIDNLPVFSKEIEDQLLAITSNTKSPSVFSEGRHNTLIKIMGGKIMDGMEVTEILKESIDYDELNHTPPYFSDSSERHGGHGYASALAMLNSIVQTQARKGDVYNPTPRIEINFSEPNEKPKFVKLPKLRGIGADLFGEVYNNSPVPRSQFAFASSINTMSMIIGTTATLDGIGANIFQYIIAPSGSGKEMPELVSKAMLSACESSGRIAASSPTSETTVLAQLETGREKCFFINEADKFLKRINDGRANHGLKECLTELFDKVGRETQEKATLSQHSKEKLQTYGGVFSPFINMYLSSTLNAFSDNMGLDSFDTGFGSRFLYFFEDRYKRANRIGSIYEPNKNITRELFQIKSATRFGSIKPLIADINLKYDIPALDMSQATRDLSEDIRSKIEDEKEAAQESKFAGVLNRKWVYVVKLALIDHVCNFGGGFLNKEVQADSWEWAYKAVSAIHQNMFIKLDTSVSVSLNDKNCNQVYSYIEKRFRRNNKETSMRDIHRRFCGIELGYRKKIVQDLIEQGKVQKTEEGNIASL